MNEQDKIDLLNRVSFYMYGLGRLEFKIFNTKKAYDEFIESCDKILLDSYEWVKEGVYVLEHFEPDQLNSIIYLNAALDMYIDDILSLEGYSFSNINEDISLLIDCLRYKGYCADYELLGSLHYGSYETIINRFTDKYGNKDWCCIYKQILRTIGYIDGYDYRYVINGIYGTLTTIHSDDNIVKFYGVIYSEKAV